jgi:hypothetical protein
MNARLDHPFEDANGRIGRPLAEKMLALRLGQPSLIALAATIPDLCLPIEEDPQDMFSGFYDNSSTIG